MHEGTHFFDALCPPQAHQNEQPDANAKKEANGSDDMHKQDDGIDAHDFSHFCIYRLYKEETLRSLQKQARAHLCSRKLPGPTCLVAGKRDYKWYVVQISSSALVLSPIHSISQGRRFVPLLPI